MADDASVLARRRLAAATRLVIERMVATGAPADMLAQAAERMEAFGETLAGYPHGRTYQGYAEPANAPRPEEFFDHSPLSGRANPLAPYLRSEVREGVAHGVVTFGAAYEGPPGCVHGGFVAAVHDEILGLANATGGKPGMTGTLTLRYRRGTPLGDLRAEAWIERSEGIKTWARGHVMDAEGITVEAEGLFILPRWAREAIAAHRAAGGDGPAKPAPSYFE